MTSHYPSNMHTVTVTHETLRKCSAESAVRTELSLWPEPSKQHPAPKNDTDVPASSGKSHHRIATRADQQLMPIDSDPRRETNNRSTVPGGDIATRLALPDIMLHFLHAMSSNHCEPL